MESTIAPAYPFDNVDVLDEDTDVDVLDEDTEVDEVDDELLVEEISIDGMCGVY